MRAQKERYKIAGEPIVILLLFLGIIFLATIGIINPVIFGIVGTVTVFLLFIEPYLYRIGLVKGAEQRFLYNLLVICLGLLLYGAITQGILPIISFTNSIIIDTAISMSIYTIIAILIIVFVVAYFFKDELKKYF